MRITGGIAAFALSILLAASVAPAAEYPKSAISLIVPAAAGGGTDLSARTFAKYAKAELGQPLVVVNVGGGGGFNGTKKVHDAAPDGYNVLFFHNNVILNHLSGVAPYSIEGFEVGPRLVSDSATGFFVSAASPWKTMPEFIAAAKAKPGEISTATEIGGYTYFMILSLQEAVGIALKMVDVGGNSEKATALLGGHIDSMPNSYGTVQGYVKSGDFRSLGFVSEKRSDVFPDVPTCEEQGVVYSYPGYEFSFFFPKGTPKEIIRKFDDAAQKIAGDERFKKDIQKLGFAVSYLAPEENLKSYQEMEKMYERLAAAVKK